MLELIINVTSAEVVSIYNWRRGWDHWLLTSDIVVPVLDSTCKKCTRQLCTEVQIVQCKMENLHLFSIEEFLERFKIQNGDKLDKAGNDGLKKARILVNSLPTRVVTNIQCQIKLKLLTETSFEELERQLTSSYSIKKSVTGAAINFVTRKQKQCIECYSKTLNELASKCAYKDCCHDRMLRDIFVSGLRSSKLATMLRTECEEKTFHECVELAKLLEQVVRDVEDINPSANEECDASAYGIGAVLMQKHLMHGILFSLLPVHLIQLSRIVLKLKEKHWVFFPVVRDSDNFFSEVNSLLKMTTKKTSKGYWW